MKAKWSYVGVFMLAVTGSSCGTSHADPIEQIRAANVIVENSTGQGDQTAGANLEDTLQEINPDLKKTIVGAWKVTNLGHNLTGTVTFKADGNYTIDTGYFEAGGSWMPSPTPTKLSEASPLGRDTCRPHDKQGLLDDVAGG